MGDIVPLGRVLRDRMAGGQPLQSRLDGMRNSMQSATRANMLAAHYAGLRQLERRRRIFVSIAWFANGVGIVALLAALWFFATGMRPW